MSDGRLVQLLEGPGEGLEWLTWHPRGDVLLAGSEDFTMWMWLAQSGNCMQVGVQGVGVWCVPVLVVCWVKCLEARGGGGQAK